MLFSYVEIPLFLGNVREGSTMTEKKKKDLFADTPDKV
jgi:hypothetical protein